MTKKVDPLMGALSLFDVLIDRTLGNEYWRDGCLTESWDNIVVDTIMTCFDTGLPETGIQRNNEPWVVVEQYDTQEDAEKGHAKWIKIMKEDPNTKLIDIGVWDT
jgi:hypothetical protein